MLGQCYVAEIFRSIPCTKSSVKVKILEVCRSRVHIIIMCILLVVNKAKDQPFTESRNISLEMFSKFVLAYQFWSTNS